MRRAALALTLCAALGCPAAPTTPEVTNTCTAEPGPADGQPTASLGRQVDGPFQPLVDGDVLPIVHGPQGGQHVYVSVRSFTRTSGTWVYTFRVEDAQGTEVGSSTQAVNACGPGWTTSTYVRVFLDYSATGSSVVFLSARPQGSPPPVPDAGVGPLDQQVHVTLQ